MTEPKNTREWLMQIDTKQESIFREIESMKTTDLQGINDRLDTLNGSVAANTLRSIQGEAYWSIAKLVAKVGIPVTAGALIGTNLCGIW